jgi:hypothetical protein
MGACRGACSNLPAGKNRGPDLQQCPAKGRAATGDEDRGALARSLKTARAVPALVQDPADPSTDELVPVSDAELRDDANLARSAARLRMTRSRAEVHRLLRAGCYDAVGKGHG